MQRKKPRPKKCKECKQPFMPFNSMQEACGVSCALTLGKKKKEKVIKKRHIKRKKELENTVPIWTKKAQKAFNEYIRVRDHDKPCISCGKYEHELKIKYSRGGVWDCGHYRSIGSCPELRFHSLNAHKQCKYCNSHLSGNIVEYRLGLIQRITDEELEWIEGPHEPKRYRVEELEEVQKEFKQKTKYLKLQAMPNLS